MSVAKIYMKAKQAVENLLEDSYDIDDDLYDMFIGDMSPVEYNNDLLRFQNDITEDISEEIKELKIFSDQYYSSKNADEKRELKLVIQEIKDDLLHLKTNRENFISK